MVNIRSIVKLCTLALLFASGPSSTQHLEGNLYPHMREDIHDRPAGIAVRIQEKTLRTMWISLAKMLPHLLEYDVSFNKLEQKWDYRVFFGLIHYELFLRNIHWNEPDIGIYDTQIKFIKHRFDDVQRLNFKFGAVHNWDIHADVDLETFLLPLDGNMTFSINGLRLEFSTLFKTTA
jgi:hypothetical protein